MLDRDKYHGTDDILCTYCGNVIGSLDGASEGDRVECGACEVTFELKGPPESRFEKVVECPECDGDARRGVGGDRAGRVEGITHGDEIECRSCGESITADVRGARFEEVPADSETYEFARMIPVEGMG